MSATHDTPLDSRESADDLDHGTGPSNEPRHDLPFFGDEAANDAGPSSTPRLSLFSPDVPAMTASASSPSLAADNARTHAEGSPPSPVSARPLSVLAGAAAMSRRAARLTVSDEQPPIAPLTPRIPSAQKDVDDPTTPLDSHRSNQSTRRDYTSLTLSRLFAADVTLPSSQPASRTPSYNHAAGPLYLRASSEAISLNDHLYTRGFIEGRHSDITVVAFGRRYNLHRLILDRAPFFTSALSEPWIESKSREVKLHPEEIDVSITQAAFELAIKKLYGCDISKECDIEAIGLFATGCWLEMQDLIDSSIESILRQMSPDTLAPLIRLVTSNYYGRSGDRILESAKAMLSRNGWEMPLKYWDGMPGDVIRELVASDGFFVDSEWDRWVLTKRLLDRRLRQAAVDAGLIDRGRRPIPKAPDSLSLMAVRFDAVYRQNSSVVSQGSSDEQASWLALYTNPDIERILVLLDEGIHYIHMEYEQLEFIRKSRDVFGLPVLPEKVISNALWQQLALRQKVLMADDSAQELGLAKPAPEPSTAVSRPVSKGKQRAYSYLDDDETERDTSGSWDGNSKPRKFWIPSSDCNIVLGNGADPVVTTSNSFQRHASRLSATLQPEDAQWATDFASSPSTMMNPNTRTDYPGRPISAGGGNAGQPKPIAYTEFPPFRFSAEFPNPRFLKEKKRVYSRTVSYAGSLWNIYIQKVRSAKNVQLGVYLHRAKERESDEVPGAGLSQQNASSVDERIGQLEREMLLRSERRDRRRSNRTPILDQAGEEDTSGSGGDADGTLTSTGVRNPLFTASTISRRRSGLGSSTRDSFPRSARSPSSPFQSFQSLATSPPDGRDADTNDTGVYAVTSYEDSEASSSDSGDDEPQSAYPNPSLLRLMEATRKSQSQAHSSAQRASVTSILPSYVDARPTIKTYFKIYSPSKGGRMLSIYESAPDRFNFSQSWGWKSSTLMLDEGNLGGGGEEGGEGEGRKKKDGKLRFMVVIGNL